MKSFKIMSQKTLIRILIYFLIAFVISITWYGFKIFNKVYMPNVKIKDKYYNLYIPTGSTFEDVIKIFDKSKILKDINSFIWVAKKRNYHKKVKPGCYKIKNNMTNNQLVNKLKFGLQDPVKLVINNIKSKTQLAKVVSRQIEADSLSLITLLNDDNYLQKIGFTKETVLAIFIPNTYEFWWNTNAKQFIERMINEYNKFWNENRLSKAKEIGLNPIEIITLASIIEEETIHDSEKPIIAGVYINRLNKKIPLQADPTIKFILGDLTIRRILKKDLQIDSPYNTYKYIGLPPGPIRIPSISSIEAVLNYKRHNYLYFCASPDFSGYHVFSETLSKHNLNARLYQRALNKNKIFR